MSAALRQRNPFVSYGARHPVWPFSLNERSQQARGLRLWFPMLPVGGNTLFDGKERQNGTLVSMATTAWTADAEMGTVLDFDSVNDEVTFGSTVYADSNLPFSVSFWCNLDDFSDAFPGFFQLQSDTGFGYTGFANTTDANYRPVSFGSRGAFDFARIQPTTDWSSELLGAWNHLLITYNGNGNDVGTNFQLYRNGGLESTQAAGEFAEHGNNNTLGREGTASNFWDGRLKDFRVYDRVVDPGTAWEMWHRPTRWDLYQPLLKRRSLRLFPAFTGILDNPIYRIRRPYGQLIVR